MPPDWSAYIRKVYLHQPQKDYKAAKFAELDDDEAKKIIKVGLLLRKYILMDQETFSGTFPVNCLLNEHVAIPLLTLIDVMLEGTGSVLKDSEHLDEQGDLDDRDRNARLKIV